VRENNTLHLDLINLKEECDQKESQLALKMRQLQSEKEDVVFLSMQKDFRIGELEK